MRIMKALAGLALAGVLLSACGVPVSQPNDKADAAPGSERILTLEAHVDGAPFDVTVTVTGKDGKPVSGLKKNTTDHVASGTWTRTRRVGSTPLTIVVQVQTAKKHAGWTSIKGGIQEVYTPVDEQYGVSISTYAHKP